MKAAAEMSAKLPEKVQKGPFKDLKIIVHAEGHMRTQVLRAHVTRLGGMLMSVGGDKEVHFLCCDKKTATNKDKIRELWGKSTGKSQKDGEWLVLDNTFITKSVHAHAAGLPHLEYKDFVLEGVVPETGAGPERNKRPREVCCEFSNYARGCVRRVCSCMRCGA